MTEAENVREVAGGQGVSLHPSVPFHTLLYLSELCIWKSSATQTNKKKEPPHMKENVRGKGHLWQSFIKGGALFWFSETTQVFAILLAANRG